MVQMLSVLMHVFFLGVALEIQDDIDCDIASTAFGQTASQLQVPAHDALEALRTYLFSLMSTSAKKAYPRLSRLPSVINSEEGSYSDDQGIPQVKKEPAKKIEEATSAEVAKPIVRARKIGSTNWMFWKSFLLGIRQKFTKKRPASAVGLDGGDKWGFAKVSKDELQEIAHEACTVSSTVPVIAQYLPGRSWLYQSVTKNATIPPELLYNIGIVLIVSLLSRVGPASQNGPLRGLAEEYVAGVAKAWTLSATMISFLLSFFLNRSYELWRDIYTTSRRIQGRLSDIAILCATFAQRDPSSGRFTREAEELLQTIARYCRLFHILFYATVTSRYAPLKTPQGLDLLIAEGMLTTEEKEYLLRSSTYHDIVIGWIGVLIDKAAADGLLNSSYERSRGMLSNAVPMVLQNRIVELRSTYASLKDKLSGRMPLAYVHLVQIVTDVLILFTLVALTYSVGTVGVLMSTVVVTFFYSTIVSLAKLFLDPLNNELEKKGSDPGSGGIRVATLLQESNFGTDRWRKSTYWVPSEVWQPPTSGSKKDRH